MTTADHLRIDPRIVHQTMDGEVVIINLDTGCYYSLTGTAAEIWSLLEQGKRTAELIEVLDARYEAVAGAIEQSLTHFLTELRDEGLVMTAETPPPSIVAAHRTHAPSPLRVPYQIPLLQKYTDMQDLLLIDPIHDVAESGWPVKPSDTQPPS